MFVFQLSNELHGGRMIGLDFERTHEGPPGVVEAVFVQCIQSCPFRLGGRGRASSCEALADSAGSILRRRAGVLVVGECEVPLFFRLLAELVELAASTSNHVGDRHKNSARHR